MGGKVQKVHFWGPKGPHFWGPAPPQKKSILATGLKEPGQKKKKKKINNNNYGQDNALFHMQNTSELEHFGTS